MTPGVQWIPTEDPIDSAKFHEYRDVPSGPVLERLRFRWEPKEHFYFDLHAIDLVQKDQRIGLEFGRRDLWKATIAWQENPRRWTDHARSLYANRGGASFTLDDTLQAAIQAAPASADLDADGRWDAGTKGALLRRAIGESADSVFVGHQRKTGTAGVAFTPTRSWTLSVQAGREERAGTVPQSLGMYFTLSPSEVAAPVDFRTETVALSAEFARRQWNAGVSVAGSRFDNRFQSLTWDDQLALADTGSSSSALPARGRMALWTDSEVRRAAAYGGVNLPGNTRINARVSLSSTTQDNAFLPKTTNSLLAPAPLPARSLDGEYRESLGDIRVSSRPLKWLRWGAWLRDFEHDNRSPELHFTDYVMTDYTINKCSLVRACDANGDGTANDPIQRTSLPYSYERANRGGSVAFTPLSWLDAGLSWERESWDREFSAAESADEDIWKATADLDVTDWLSVRSSFRRQERRVDDYDVNYFEESFPAGEPIGADFNEGSRRFTWTDRDRNVLALMAEITPVEWLALHAEASWNHDDYLDPATGKDIGDSYRVREDRDADGVKETYDILLSGRTGDRAASYSAGFALNPAKRFDLYGDYTWEVTRYGMESRYRCPGTGAAGSCPTGATFVNVGSDSPLDDWGSDAKDRYRTASLGFNLRLTGNGAWTMDGDAQYAVGKGDLMTHFTPGGVASGDTTLADFPQLKNRLTSATLSVTHRVRDNLDYGLRYWYESWNEDNWASDFMRSYMGDPGNDPGSATAVYLGMDFEDYRYQVLSVFLNYRF